MSQFPFRTMLLLALAIGVAGQDIPMRELVPGKPIGAGLVRQLSYSPDGHLLAVETTVGFQIREADSGRLLNTITDNFPPRPEGRFQYAQPWFSELCWSPDGKHIARAATQIEIWDPLAAQPERALPSNPGDNGFHELAWSPRGDQIAARSDTGILVWNLDRNRRIAIPEKPPRKDDSEINGYSWAPDGEQLAIVAGFAEGESIDIWNVSRLALVKRIPVGKNAPRNAPGMIYVDPLVLHADQSKVQWSPDGQVLALYSGFQGLSLWDANMGSMLPQVSRPWSWTDGLVSLSWSDDSNFLRIGLHREIRILRRDTGAVTYALKIPGRSEEDWIRSSAASPDGTRLAASYADGRIVLWRGRNQQPSGRIQAGTIANFGVVISPDATQMAATSGDVVAGVWNLSSGMRLATFEGSYAAYTWSSDSHTLAIVSGPKFTLDLLRPSSGQAARTIALPDKDNHYYTTASWSPDGASALVTAGPDGIVVQLETGAITPVPPAAGCMFWTATSSVVRCPVHAYGVLQSPDFRLMALRGRSPNKLTVWDTQESRDLWALDEPPGRSLDPLAFSPDSRRLAYVSKTGALEVLDLSTGKVVEQLTGPVTWNWGAPVSISWGEKLVAVEQMDGAVRLWREP